MEATLTPLIVLIADLYVSGVLSLVGLYLAVADNAREAAQYVARAVLWPFWLPFESVRIAAGTAAAGARAAAAWLRRVR